MIFSIIPTFWGWVIVMENVRKGFYDVAAVLYLNKWPGARSYNYFKDHIFFLGILHHTYVFGMTDSDGEC